MSRNGCYSSRGRKIAYPSEEAVLAAIKRRIDDVVKEDGTPWRNLRHYECKKCKQWHFTSSAGFRVSKNYMNGGWARFHLVEDIELGHRAAVQLFQENRVPGKQVAGLKALKRFVLRNYR